MSELNKVDVFCSFCRDDPIVVEFLVKTFEEEIYQTEAKYDVTILLANIGGQLGLFTGFSFLTGFEILELFTDLFLTLCGRLGAKVWWGAQVLPGGDASLRA